jgi:translocator protein
MIGSVGRCVLVLTTGVAVVTAFQPAALLGVSYRAVRSTETNGSWPRRQSPSLPTHRTFCSLPLESSNEATNLLSNEGRFDFDAVAKYGAAILVQMSLITLLFTGLDRVVTSYSLRIPTAVNCVLFYMLALKSRVFNPMSNTRPQPRSLEVGTSDASKSKAAPFQRNMPSWTPPGFVFPIVWLLIIGPIRALTSAMIYQNVGSYASLPILSLMLHLSIGDVWNTVNNVERRFGVSVIGVCCVWISKAHAVYRYGIVNSLAGKLLGATLVWLTIASALVTATWRLNPDPTTGQPEPLYPIAGKVQSKFAWFSGVGQ